MVGKHQAGNLKCNNKKCGRMFEVYDFKPNSGIRCPHCDKSAQYRTQDFIRATYPKK